MSLMYKHHSCGFGLVQPRSRGVLSVCVRGSARDPVYECVCVCKCARVSVNAPEFVCER